jgi:glycine/D-amino acid oxidase-like deaminating enzyme
MTVQQARLRSRDDFLSYCKARRLKEHPFWWDTVPGFGARPDRSSLQASGSSREYDASHQDDGRPQQLGEAVRRVDVAIIGAGYTGLAAARQLAKSGAAVVVFESEHAGWGASSRNAGQVLTGLRVDPQTLVARYGDVAARALFAASLESIDALESLIQDEAIECEYERSGHIQAASKPDHFRAFQKEQELLKRVFGHDVKLVDRGRQHAELGSSAYYGLLVDDRSAGLNPARYVAGLADAAKRAGAVLVEGTRVRRLARHGTRWIVSTSRGEVDAGDVLAATNGYTEAPLAALQRRLVPIGSYVVVTAPLGDDLAAQLLPTRRMGFDSKHLLYFFRLTRDNRLLFGGRAEFGRPDANATRRAVTILQRGLAAVFPEAARVPVEYAWSGNVAFARDEMPHAGRVEEVFFAGGYGGHGIAMATCLGGLIARRIAGEPVTHPLFDRPFLAIPLYWGRPWFLPLVDAYFRFRDRIE